MLFKFLTQHGGRESVTRTRSLQLRTRTTPNNASHTRTHTHHGFPESIQGPSILTPTSDAFAPEAGEEKKYYSCLSPSPKLAKAACR